MISSLGVRLADALQGVADSLGFGYPSTMADKEPTGLHWNPLVGLMWKTVPIGLIVSLTLLALAQIYIHFIRD